MAKNGEVTVKTLEDTPERALNLLMGVTSSAGIFNLLRTRGYSVDEHERGWKLLHDAGLLRFEEESLDGRTDASRALGELDNLDESVFRLTRASLENGFPDQAALVLEGIGPAQGPMVVLQMGLLLERLAQLDGSKKEHDKKALAKLAQRGLDKVERERLTQLVEAARSLPAVKAPDTARDARRRGEYQDSLKQLRAWYVEWSEVARATIARRDYLIRLGLAAPRRDKGDEEGPDEVLDDAGGLANQTTDRPANKP
jgi:hypothetical protein